VDLKEYIRLIRRNLILFLVIALIVPAVALIWTWRMPLSYNASVSLSLNKPSPVRQKDVSYYLYDDYYSVQAAATFIDTVAGWFASPSIVTQIYQKSGIATPNISLKKLSKIFSIKKAYQFSNSLDVTVTSGDKDEAQKLISSAADVIKAQNDEIKAQSKSDTFFTITSSSPVVYEVKPPIITNTLAGLLIGLILALTVVFVKAALRETAENPNKDEED